MGGVDYLIHVASPCTIEEPDDPDEIIVPAIKGVKNVVQAAIDQGVKKVVVTSSTTTVSFGEGNETKGLIYDESNFSPDNLQAQKRPYNISKLRAEQTAWDLFKKYPDSLDLSVIVPSIFMGPILINKPSPSLDFFKKFFSGQRMIRLSFGYCDVRDVAKAHIAAMELKEKSKGKRYIISENSYWFQDIMEILK